MSDEEKKRIVSQPPPPTDEVDGEWGDDDQTLVRELPESVTQSESAPSAAAVAGTAVAPISVPAKAVDEEEVDEEEEVDDEEEEEEEDDHASDDHGHAPAAPAAAASDWLPEWAPFAVLALLVSVSLLVGLGLVGGSAESSERDAAEPAAESPKAVTKPSGHP
jgi:hypothetical protein